jgi:hypothetical protein
MTVMSPQKCSILTRIPLLFHPNDRNKTPKCSLLTWSPLLFHPNDRNKTPKMFAFDMESLIISS